MLLSRQWPLSQNGASALLAVEVPAISKLSANIRNPFVNVLKAPRSLFIGPGSFSLLCALLS